MAYGSVPEETSGLQKGVEQPGGGLTGAGLLRLLAAGQGAQAVQVPGGDPRPLGKVVVDAPVLAGIQVVYDCR